MHAGNIALHALNAVLVLLLLGALFGRPRLAFATALIFAVHPIATEAVIPVAGRADLLASFCVLLACVLGLAAVRRRGTWFLVGAIGVSFVTFSAHWRRSTPSWPRSSWSPCWGRTAAVTRGTPGLGDYRLTAATLAGLQVFVLLMVLLLRVQILGYVFNTSPPENPSTAYLAFVNNPIQFAEPLPACSRPCGWP